MLANPHRYGEMAQYRCVIHQASQKFIWSAVYAYDVRFRQESARVGGRRFDILDQSLYTTTLDATALKKDAKQCSRCKSFDHETRECPFLPASALETPAQKKSPSNPQGTYRPAQPWKLEKWFQDNCEGCNLFQWHACNLGTGCKWAHVCKACRGATPWQIAHNLPEPWSPFSVAKWSAALANHLDNAFVEALLHDITHRVELGYSGPTIFQSYPNHLSALDASELIIK